ncbi:hypothetical protein [Streptomyces boninensis]|uniref:hypothetical protein n=1 Tax=Streptomyces boninensis TaxID=2039455 RepID=UPI003B2250B4
MTKHGIHLALVTLAVMGAGACASSATTLKQPSATRALPADESASPSAQDEPYAEETRSTRLLRNRERAEERLSEIKDRGNAMSDVSVRGISVKHTGDDLRAGLVRINNSSDEKAFYSIQVNFVAAHGNVVDTVFIGQQDIEPGELVDRHALSREAADAKGRPTVAKAQRD